MSKYQKFIEEGNLYDEETPSIYLKEALGFEIGSDNRAIPDRASVLNVDRKRHKLDATVSQEVTCELRRYAFAKSGSEDSINERLDKVLKDACKRRNRNIENIS